MSSSKCFSIFEVKAMCNTFSAFLACSAEGAIEAISLALHSVSHRLKKSSDMWLLAKFVGYQRVVWKMDFQRRFRRGRTSLDLRDLQPWNGTLFIDWVAEMFRNLEPFNTFCLCVLPDWYYFKYDNKVQCKQNVFAFVYFPRLCR